MKIGITSKDSDYHYVNIMGIESHEKAINLKRKLESFLNEQDKQQLL